jgi:hypothetical protein
VFLVVIWSHLHIQIKRWTIVLSVQVTSKELDSSTAIPTPRNSKGMLYLIVPCLSNSVTEIFSSESTFNIHASFGDTITIEIGILSPKLNLKPSNYFLVAIHFVCHVWRFIWGILTLMTFLCVRCVAPTYTSQKEVT